MKPAIQIGKGGISEGVIEEVKRQLKEAKIVKIKFLKSALGEKGRAQLAKELQEKTGGELVELRGNTVIFRRK